MFGYVRPAADRLTEEQEACFRAAYCGLCHTLGERYGLPGRMILNYDLTFLAMLLSEGQDEQCRKRCVMHPLKGRTCTCGGEAFALAADMSVILTWWQIQDGIADHGFWSGLKYRAALWMLRRAYRKARLLRPAFDEGTQRHLKALSQLEKEKCHSIDAAADTFAQLLSGAADEVEEPVKRRVLAQMLYHLGRWIYLIDGADDLKKDAESGNYNPVALRYGLTDGVWTPESRRDFATTLDHSIHQMAAAFELWDFGVWTPVLQSTFYGGLFQVGKAVLDGRFHRPSRKNIREFEETE